MRHWQCVPRPRCGQRGSLLLWALGANVVLILFVVNYFTLFQTVVRVPTQAYLREQALGLAEAGLHAVLWELNDPPATGAFDAARGWTACGATCWEILPASAQTLAASDGTPIGQYTARVTGVGTSTPSVTANGFVPAQAAPSAQHGISATLTAASGNPFPYAVATGALNVSGSAVLGADNARIDLYVEDTLVTSSGSTIWAGKVDFLNSAGAPLSTLCPNCTKFPVSPPPAPVFNTSGVSEVDDLTFDFWPYYDQALAQQAIDGQSYHHITAATTIDGNLYPNCLEGIIYVEAGVDVTLKNDVCIKGTIVHEGTAVGFTQGGNQAYFPGHIKSGSSLRLWIDSFSNTDLDNNGWSEPAFAPGVAILGSPIIDLRSSVQLVNWAPATTGNPDPDAAGIRGFVMAGSESQQGGANDLSSIAATGTIKGGLIGIYAIGWVGMPFYTTFGHNQDGPEVWWVYSSYTNPGEPYILTITDTLLVGGAAEVRFEPLTEFPPGLLSPIGSEYTISHWDYD